MPVYRIKQGQKHYYRNPNAEPHEGRNHVFVGGDLIELEEFQAKPFLDKMELVRETGDERVFRETKAKRAKKASLKVEKVGEGEYNVINQTTKKPINDKPLTKAEADKLAAV